jgi:hypothetical protein
MSKRFWIDPRDKPGLLVAVMRELAGNAEIAFEGGLGELDLENIAGAHFQETDALRRQTLKPQLDFIVLPLTAESVDVIWRIISENGLLTDPMRIIHAQIALDGRLVFAGCDNFHRECVSAWEGFPIELLDRLIENGVIRSYRSAPEGVR